MGRGQGGANCQEGVVRREQDGAAPQVRLETMYHVARRDAREAISREGLKPRKPEDNVAGVYLWPALDDAEEYGASGVHGDGAEADAYEVQVPVNELWDDDVWGCGAAYTHKPIPPERLTLISPESLRILNATPLTPRP